MTETPVSNELLMIQTIYLPFFYITHKDVFSTLYTAQIYNSFVICDDLAKAMILQRCLLLRSTHMLCPEPAHIAP